MRRIIDAIAYGLYIIFAIGVPIALPNAANDNDTWLFGDGTVVRW